MSRIFSPGRGALLCRHAVDYLHTGTTIGLTIRSFSSTRLTTSYGYYPRKLLPLQLFTSIRTFSVYLCPKSPLNNVFAYPTYKPTSLGLNRFAFRLQPQKQLSNDFLTGNLFKRTKRKDLLQFRQNSSLNKASQSKDANVRRTKSELSSTTPKNVEDIPGKGIRDRSLLERLPDISHRFHAPTKEELLAAATGFWSRLRVRFKWFSIRSLRPFNMDDISAFFSWILVGHVIWILVGTTTFFSLLILALNTVFAQETLARWVGTYLTKSSGVKIVFESAIVPKWKNGVITFRNVFVSRRPGQKKTNVTKGSQTSAAAAAAAALSERAQERGEPEEEDTNYTQYELSIDSINVTLSFARWFNGRGLLKDVEVKGIRGVIDRTSVEETIEYVDPRLQRHQHQTGDFELESFRLDDLLVTMYQPNEFRPFSVSVYSADLPQLRKQWLFYDFLSANHMSGSFDNSLFTIHPRQTDNYTGAQLNDGTSTGDQSSWKKQSRIRIDGLNIDHLNRGVEGPFGWIHSGNVDIVADIMFPHDNDESISKVISDFYSHVEATVTQGRYLQQSETVNNHPGTENSSNFQMSKSSSSSIESPQTKSPKIQQSEDTRPLILDLRINLNSVQAAVPLFNQDLSYVNNALIRPIVAYINSRRNTYIPITCRVVKRADEFDGSWTIFDSGLMEDLSRETYEAFARDVVDDQARMRRIKKVGLWSLQLAVQALFLGLAGNVA